MEATFTQSFNGDCLVRSLHVAYVCSSVTLSINASVSYAIILQVTVIPMKCCHVSVDRWNRSLALVLCVRSESPAVCPLGLLVRTSQKSDLISRHITAHTSNTTGRLTDSNDDNNNLTCNVHSVKKISNRRSE